MTAWHLFQHLWTKAVGTKDYDKAEWRRMEQVLLDAGIGP